MKTRIFGVGLLAATFSLLAWIKPLAADDLQTGVARVSLIRGDVSTMRGDSGDWAATTVNAPLVQGDKISTGPRSRTEIQLDHSNILRLDQQSEVKLASLSRTRIQVQLAQGLMSFTVLKGSEADVEINTPNVAVLPLEEGIYRVQVNSNSETEVIVRKGRAEVSTPEGSTRIEKNDQVTIQGTDSAQYRVVQAPGRDDWDRWNQDRDDVIRDAQSWRHANRYYTGAYELDRYGRWDSVPGYGYVWSPYADPYWSPYRSGRWVWQPYWGWTWVSYEPWGWAPYHYGRWFVYGGSWRWWPGPVHISYRPVWAPAYVSFLGFGFGGRNWSFGFGFGYRSVGWLPLGPCDTYYPWYGARQSYNVVNITNVTNIRNITRVSGIPAIAPLADGRTRPYISNLQSVMTNERLRRSVASVSTDDFVRGRTTVRTGAVDVQTLRQAQVVAGTVPIVPTRESLRSLNRPVNPASLPTRVSNTERFFTRNQPPAGPQPFTQRAAEIQQMVQRYNPLASSNSSTVPSRREERTLRNSPEHSQRTENSRVQQPSNPGWQRFESGQPNGRAYTNDDLNRRNQMGNETASGETTRRSAALSSRSDVQSLGETPQQRGNSQPLSTREVSDPRSGWQRFSNRSVTERPGRSAVAPSNSNGILSQGVSRSRPATSGNADRSSRNFNSNPGSDGSSWNLFPSRPQPGADRRDFGRSNGLPSREMSAPPLRRETPSPMRQNRSYYRESPTRMERPPLELNKPIVTQRTPRSYDGSGSRSDRIDRRSQQSGARNYSSGSRFAGRRQGR